MDKLTRERLEHEKRGRDLQLANMIRLERSETSRQLQQNNHEMQLWVDHHMGSVHRGNYFTHEMTGLQDGFSRTGMQASLRYPRIEGQIVMARGRLYRSKSDETLSVSSTHNIMPGMLEQCQATSPEYDKCSIDIDHRLLQTHGMPQRRCTTSHHVHSDDSILGPRLPPSGRSPDGQLTSAIYSEEISHSSLPEEWTNASIIKHFVSHNNLVEDSKPNIIINTVSSGNITRPTDLQQINPLSSEPFGNIHGNHSKTDSGSNPDSGYCSKIYTCRPAKSIPTSFSSVYQDTHNSSLSTTASTCTTEPSLVHSTQDCEKLSKPGETQVVVHLHCQPSQNIHVITEESTDVPHMVTSDDVCNNNMGKTDAFVCKHNVTDV